MRKLLNKPWMVGTLVVAALLLAILRSGRGAGVRDAAPMPGNDASSVEAEIATGGARPPAIGTAIDLALQTLPAHASLRDPFVARHDPAVAPGVTELVHLSAIWTENGATLVLINDRILQAGDAVGSMTIESATDDGVWIAHGKGRDFLSLGEIHIFHLPAPIAAAGPP